VNPETAQRLLALNQQFYQTFAVQFDATRQRLHPGVRCLLEGDRFVGRVLDLGCGNGELACQLAMRNFAGRYVGLDFSHELLSIARRCVPDEIGFEFYTQDLAAEYWQAVLPEPAFNTILAFAVMHHLPGLVLRRQLMDHVRHRLLPGGEFIHSNWQFLNSPRLAQRIQPWSAIEMSEEALDFGDYLLDWRSGGLGLRYVHVYSQQELAELAEASGFQIIESFSSDGDTGDLSLYQVWRVV
jgi:tRNA (uracil-5-)-methyltransferase TRM9